MMIQKKMDNEYKDMPKGQYDKMKSDGMGK